jgi:putative beta-lysine N-acetyltransferase
MAESDIVEKIGKSLIHHGKQSDRIYLMKFCQSDMPRLPAQLRVLAESRGYSKVICKIPSDHLPAFAAEGYFEEAEIPGYFSGNGKCVFVSRFMNKEREKQTDKDLTDGVLATAKRRKKEEKTPVGIADGLSCEIMREGNAVEMARLYRAVFDTYPFPIHDPEYIVRTMRENVVYFGVRKDGGLIALSSIEADMQNRNAEMTDFATLPEYRGGGLAK